MRREVRSRLVFVGINSLLTVLVAGAATGLGVLGVARLGWPAAWPFVALGALAGATIGVIRDPRVLEAALGVTGAVLLAFGMSWARGGTGGVPVATVAPLLESGALSFATLLALTRLWRRHVAVPDMTPADVDDVLAGPGMGVIGHD